MRLNKKLRIKLYAPDLVNERLFHKKCKEFEDKCKIVNILNPSYDSWPSIGDKSKDEKSLLQSSNHIIKHLYQKLKFKVF
jgi:hypothetical protein